MFNPRVSLVCGTLLAVTLWLLACFAGDPAAAVFGAHAVWLFGLLWICSSPPSRWDASSARIPLASALPGVVATAAGLWIGMVTVYPWLAATLYLLTQLFFLLLTRWLINRMLAREFPELPRAGRLSTRILTMCAALALAGVLLGVGLRGLLG